LLQKLGVRRFHLYGQSFGGILAYEYLKKIAETPKDGRDNDDDEGCLSVILSSSPWNVSQVQEEAGRLVEALESPELFRQTHQCQTPEMPLPLQKAYAKAGTVWRGADAIADYVAQAPTTTTSSSHYPRLPSCLVLRGEHDFVTPPCVQGWKHVFSTSRSVRFRTLEGCSHHGLLENPALYGDVVDSFLAEYD